MIIQTTNIGTIEVNGITKKIYMIQNRSGVRFVAGKDLNEVGDIAIKNKLYDSDYFSAYETIEVVIE